MPHCARRTPNKSESSRGGVQRQAAAAAVSLHPRGSDHPPPPGCSFPSDTLLDELLLGNLKPSALDAEARAALWGWDAVGPAGLLQRAYSFLGIPRKAWPGLMRLPSVCQRGVVAGAGVDEFVALVRRWGAGGRRAFNGAPWQHPLPATGRT
jgi:hypothetical protein